MTKLFSIFLTATLSLKLVASAPPNRISMLTFNVENLFDTRHDPGKDDFTYLPKAQKTSIFHQNTCRKIKIRKWREDCLNLDWSEKAVATKLERIAQVIKSVGKGHGPDIVFFQEVENIGLLQTLAAKHLPGLGYHALLLEGEDERGVDVGMLTRFSLERRPVLHKIPGDLKTRGILEVHLWGPGHSIIRAFALHLPSAFHSYRVRRKALEFLDRLAVPEKGGSQRSELTVAAGDFNITSDEERRYGLVKAYAQGNWLVSHFEGCASCAGTILGNRKWSFFDQIWIRRDSLQNGWKLLADSIRVVNEQPFQRSPKGPGPWRSEILPDGSFAGVSDHWPLALEVERIPPPRSLVKIR